MKNWIHIPIAALVALAVGAASGLLGTEARTSTAHDGSSDATALSATLDELRAEQRTLAERVAALPTAAAPAPIERRAPARDLDQAIADYMAKQLSTPSDGSVAAAPEDLESAAIADRILSGQVTGDALNALWAKLREEKRIDAVVAEIERQAELAPNNPDIQTQLGDAYIEKLFDVGMGPLAGVWAKKADAAYDRALELDDTHWNARFSKAISLSNSPTFLGKQTEAVRQFEILMEQQERATPANEHARTYYFLGNLYDQNGDHTKALATWRRGLERFPANEDLLAKTGGGR